MTKRTRQQAREKKKQKAVAIYHDMKVYENFERCAQRIFECIKAAQRESPGAPRILYIDIQGHRNEVGGFDHDACELITEFSIGFLMNYLTELHTPLLHIENPKGQRNDLPDLLRIGHPKDGSTYGYNANSLEVQPREREPVDRKSRPTIRAIADYLGLKEAACLVCWRKPVERAHVVPHALGGSMDVRNFALLCPTHHSEAPDVADAESFWAWVDYAELRDSPDKWLDAPDELKEWLRQHNVRIGKPEREPPSFFSAVKHELKSLYKWTDLDFNTADWPALMEEFYQVLGSATSSHFSIDKKVSTYAWAYDIARRRISGEGDAVIHDAP